MTEPVPTTPSFAVPWNWLSGALAILTIGAVTALSIVATVQEVDGLSTVALAVAVVALIAQLVIALAQAISGAQQTAQAERVNADTQSGLASIRAASDALLTTQREQFSEVLRAALARAVPEAVDDALSEEESASGGVDVDQSRLEEAVLQRLTAELNIARGPATQAAPTMSAPQPTAAARVMTTYPTEERGRDLAAIVDQLGPWEGLLFARYARSAIDRAERGRRHGAWLRPHPDGGRSPSTQRLLDAGLILIERRERLPGVEGEWMELTPLGLEVAGLVYGQGHSPSWLRWWHGR
jgi:hypothetical protein